MKRKLFVKCGIATAALVFACALPLAAPAFAADETTKPAATTQAAASETETGGHMLEWGVFAYAVGEFAGILGLGISRIRRDKNTQVAIVKKELEELPFAYSKDWARLRAES
ncbi:MAG: hypothetical protein ACK5L3_01860 [Oscillospiraceae bacterium]